MTKPARSVRIALLVAGLLAAVLTSCNDDSGAGSSGSGAFPVTLQNVYGKTVVEKQPKRVASIGFHEQDALLALGVQPVSVQQWIPEYKDGLGPWAKPLLESKPKVFPNTQTEPNLGEIAKLRPDLIVATYASVTKEQYELLSDIAPTLVRTKDQVDYQLPYDAETVTIGKALGKEKEAEALVEKTKQSFADARKAHPEFQGKDIVIGYPLKNGGIGVYSSKDPRSQFFRSLGFTIPKFVDELTGDQFFKELSPERLDLVSDADLLVVIDFHFGKDFYAKNKLYNDLDVVKRGHAIYPLPHTNAISFNTVLSIPYCVDKVSPVLTKTLERK